MKDGSVKILIAEWVPSLNKGELAILIGMLKTFEVFRRADISIFSFQPSLDRERYPKNVKIIDVASDLHLGHLLPGGSVFSKVRAFLFAVYQHFLFILLFKTLGKKALRIMDEAIWREYCRSDVIIICHDQVSCIMGFVLTFSPVYITLLAKALHKLIVIYGNGTYGFQRKIWRIMATYVLNNIDLITVRDEESFQYLEELVWNKARIYLTGDPAILLSPDDAGKIRGIMQEESIDTSNGLLVGVALAREVLSNAFGGHRAPDTRMKSAIAEIAGLFDRLIDNFKATIVFIPHCLEPYEHRDDRTLAKEIYSRMKNKHGAKVLIKEYPPGELKGLIGEFDLFIGARIHAVISALSMGVPSCVITTSSDKRAYGLIDRMLKQGKWIYDIRNLDAEVFSLGINDLLSASGEIRGSLPRIVSSAKEKALLNGRLLKTLLDFRLKGKD